MTGRDHDSRADRRLHRAYVWHLKANWKADPEILANELIQLARGNGWRPVEALQPAPLSRGHGPSDEFRAAKEQLKRRLAAVPDDPEEAS